MKYKVLFSGRKIMVTARELVVDENKVKKAVQSGIPLTITTFTLPHEIELYIEQVLIVFLRLVGQEKLKDYLVYCVQELAVNAKKANTKRVYFTERGLDLSNPDEYKLGMQDFKSTTLNNLAHYLQIQKEQGLYIKVIFQIKKDIILIEIRNNVLITKTELIRIHDKMARSRQYGNLEDALSQVLDSSEGAGLGLVILVLMLKKIGLDEDCFDIRPTEKETVARIMIPLDKTRLENLSLLSQAVVDTVKSLPQFPENILSVEKLINDPNVEMADIGRKISMDPAMTADILKIVNSAQYMLVRKVDSITEAVKMMGIRGIKNLLLSYGTQKILGNESEEQKILWEHSYRVAFYAYNLMKNFHRDHNLLDDVYVGGILHDMGKIVFSSVYPELLVQIRSFCTSKNIPISTLEDLSAGVNHAEIGALIAEHWNFPEPLVRIIRFHHDPHSTPQESQTLVKTVYLANMFCAYQDKHITFDQFDSTILEEFGVNSKKYIDTLLEQFSAAFKQEKQK